MTTNSTQFAVRTAASEDLDLVHAAQNGDVAAFERLVERYDRKLLRIAEHVTHNREDAQDVVQEAFLKAFLHLSTFREDAKFSTWLIRITLNHALMKLRKLRATKELSLEEDCEGQENTLPREVGDWAPNPEELYEKSELREILVKTLGELRPSLRVIFALRDIEGLSTHETAEVLSLTSTAVKARLYRARLELRELLTKYFRQQTSYRRSSAECDEGGERSRPAELLGAARSRAQNRVASRCVGTPEFA